MRSFAEVLAACVAAAAFASPAGADGVDLTWNSCDPTGGVTTKVFACDNDTAQFSLVVSFRSPVSLTALSSEEIVLTFRYSVYDDAPDWWQLGPGGCREGSMMVTAGPADPGGACARTPGTGMATLTAFEPGYGGDPHTTRVTIMAAFTEPAPVAADVRYAAARIVLDAAHTTGTDGDPVCAGCATAMCLKVESVALNPSSVYGVLLDQPEHVNYARWQNDLSGYACPYAIATRTSTWGAVKALYR